MTERIWTATDLAEFVERFHTAAIDLAAWSPHTTHLGVATVLCRRHPEDALDRMRAGIRTLNAANGIAGRYHETVTRFYVERILEVLAESDAGQTDAELANLVIARVGGSREQRAAVWRRYYVNPDFVWTDPAARERWVGPDIDAPGTAVAVVDAGNRFLRWTDRAEVHERRLPHRSVHVLVFDTAGRLLLQQRKADKLTYPGHWDTSVAGHVERSDYPGGPDEDLEAVYEAVAGRELEEELGIVTELTRLHSEGPQPGVHYEQLFLYEAVWDGPIRLQPEEVADSRWLAAEDWPALAAMGPVTHALRHWIGWLRESGRFRA